MRGTASLPLHPGFNLANLANFSRRLFDPNQFGDFQFGRHVENPSGIQGVLVKNSAHPPLPNHCFRPDTDILEMVAHAPQPEKLPFESWKMLFNSRREKKNYNQFCSFFNPNFAPEVASQQETVIMIQTLKVTLALLLAVLMVSCASTRQYHQYPDIESHGANTSVLHIIRKNTEDGSAIGAPVYIDDHLIGRIGPGGHLATRIPASSVSISSTNNSVTVNAHAGKQYIVEIFTPGRLWIVTFAGFDVHQTNSRRMKKLGFR